MTGQIKTLKLNTFLTGHRSIVAIALARTIKDQTPPTLSSHYDIDVSRVLEHSGSWS